MKRVVVAVATGAIFVVGYLLEWHVIAPARQALTDAASQANARSFQTDLPLWLTALGWLLMAGLLAFLAWLLFGRNEGDRVAAGLVVLIGLAVWLVVPLSYASSTAPVMAFVPNHVLEAFTGPVGYVSSTSAFVIVQGVAALARSWR